MAGFGPLPEQESCPVVPGDEGALEADAEAAVGELVDEDRAAGEVDAVASGRQLELELLEDDGVVVADDALVLGGEKQLEVDAGEGREGSFGLCRGDGEAAAS